MSLPSLLLVAHGTRDPAGTAVTERVATRVGSALPGVCVSACYADVVGPRLADALAELPGPCVVVPMFLAAGYHVRVDLPAQLRATRRTDVVLTRTFGPETGLVAAVGQRLRAAGARDADSVVLAVVGSSQPQAHAEADIAVRRLGRLLGRPVALARIAAGEPRVETVVAGLRESGASRVAVAVWLLAPGLFQRQLEHCGAEVIAAPIADHPAVVATVLARFQSALAGAGRRPDRVDA